MVPKRSTLTNQFQEFRTRNNKAPGPILKSMPRGTFMSRFSNIPDELEQDNKISKKERIMSCMRDFIENKYTNIIFIILTFVALYLDDTRIGFTKKSADVYIDTIMLFCFFAFSIELVFTSLTKQDYVFSFFFWLDLVALFSILFDIYYLLDALEVTFRLPTDATNVARAGRAGRAGTRVGRLLKIVRMIRVFRVAKLYKQTKRAIDEKRKIISSNKPGDKKVHPVEQANKFKIQNTRRLKKRNNIIISNEMRKMSFMKKIQGVKQLINFEDFESLSSEDPHLAEMKNMPLRMRTQIQLMAKKNQFIKNNMNRSQKWDSDESESESYSFSSSSGEANFKSVSKNSLTNMNSRKSPEHFALRKISLKKSPKMAHKRSLRKARKAKSLIQSEVESEEEKEILQIFKSGTLLDKGPTEFKNDSNLNIDILQSLKVVPNAIRKSNIVEAVESSLQKSVKSSSKSSLKTSKISERESGSEDTDKSSSEFDINKSLHTSKDYSTQKKESSSQGSLSSLLQSRNNIPSTKLVKINDKRKTSASSKENKKFQNKNAHKILYMDDNFRNSSPDIDVIKRRASVVSSVISFSSKATEKNLKDLETKDEMKESKVSKKFSEQTTKRVVFLVLLVVMSEYIFQLNTYVSSVKSYEYALDAISKVGAYTSTTFMIEEVQKYHEESTPYRILEFRYNNSRNLSPNGQYQSNQKGLNFVSNLVKTHVKRGLEYTERVIYDNPSKYRDQEYEIISEHSIQIYVSIKSDLQFEAYLSICKTTFILIVIMVSALLISKDATALVLQPLESIMLKVSEMAEDPFQILKFSEIEAEVKKGDAKSKVMYETMILDSAITKIGALLLLGFGEAGTSLLSDMIGKEGDIDSHAKGNKTVGIFGFCDIRQFTDTTEILQEEVMVFVNKIAEIVHSETHEYLGDPNKNIGDAFLLVWKFPQNELYADLDGEISFSKHSYLINNYAEAALISILKIIYRMRKDKRVVAYSELQKLTDKIPDYKVKMGFGLHTGWCIEGAIGSSYKIDATYLSHHVNYASSLEEKTKMYGVLLAISHEFIEACSSNAKKYFRQIDAYKEKDSKDTKKIYTINIESSFLLPDENTQILTGKENYREKVNNRLDNLVQTKDPNFRMISLMKLDPELKIMTKNVPKKLISYYKKVFELYSKGDWIRAKNGLNKILKRCQDGPSIFLLSIMKRYDYIPPKKWNGVRHIN
ncbi:unnamed protein product [Moneuplotes crassus]|uniref:Guanylate cyclase domain-containing protein n=1 Tax=Euplotes crassus TaxID=5936 RepID=A0AAD1XA75_EUPCR|nr:unnamed protein product [Moneuplotes crassus]